MIVKKLNSRDLIAFPWGSDEGRIVSMERPSGGNWVGYIWTALKRGLIVITPDGHVYGGSVKKARWLDTIENLEIKE